MMRIKYFIAQPILKELAAPCVVIPNAEVFPIDAPDASYDILPARILGLDYPTYLRFLRDAFPNAVTLIRRDNDFICPLWKRGSRELSVFVRLLNAKMTLALMKEDNNEQSEEIY